MPTNADVGTLLTALWTEEVLLPIVLARDCSLPPPVLESKDPVTDLMTP